MPTPSIQRPLLGLAACILLTYSAAALGAAASVQAGSFYAQLIRPEWAPPASVFGPVWTFLYTLMAIAAWLVWRRAGFAPSKVALTLFLAQLSLNALWSWLFFAWRLGALAFAEIVVLWMLIAACVVTFWRARPLAGALLLPYLLWVTFAAALSFSIWKLNPEIL